jgi:hypothetical protein
VHSFDGDSGGDGHDIITPLPSPQFEPVMQDEASNAADDYTPLSTPKNSPADK